jgi:hypothetical protein
MADQKYLTAEEASSLAEEAARRALAAVGLHDESAGRDVAELRSLLDSYRAVRSGALQQLGKLIMLAILAGVVVLVGMKLPN